MRGLGPTGKKLHDVFRGFFGFDGLCDIGRDPVQLSDPTKDGRRPKSRDGQSNKIR